MRGNSRNLGQTFASTNTGAPITMQIGSRCFASRLYARIGAGAQRCGQSFLDNSGSANSNWPGKTPNLVGHPPPSTTKTGN